MNEINFKTTIILVISMILVCASAIFLIKNATNKINNDLPVITPTRLGGYENVIYPVMSGLDDEMIQKTFNREIRKLVEGEIKSFVRTTKELGDGGPESVGSSFELDYKIINQNSNLISIKFAGYAYVAGAAHGDNALFSYNFNLRNGKGINLTDLFKPNSDYLDLLSDYAIRELENRNLGDSNLVKTGASQKAENFKIFNIGKDGLLFTFDDYQLGGYDTGPQTVLIPYEYLKDSLSAY